MEPSDHQTTSTARLNDGNRRIDWKKLQAQSLVPGGFGNQRAGLWVQVLRASAHDSDTEGTATTRRPRPDDPDGDEMESQDASVTTPSHEPSAHPDEHQILLDTQRSFVLYPTVGEDSVKDREPLQIQLHELLVSVFRRHPKLSYFQGYHDIATVLFLTLPPELQFACLEKLSIHRLRDSMGASLEPVLGLLRLLRSILRLADPSYASLLERNAPLPYFALSNLLTLFSHDMPTLPLIQHVFDYLLCRPPIYAVYLAAAIVLSRKEEAQRLEEEGEEGMLHSLLSGLPDIYEDDCPPEPVKAESMDGDDSNDKTVVQDPTTSLHIQMDPSEAESAYPESSAEDTLVDPSPASTSPFPTRESFKTEELDNIDLKPAAATVDGLIVESCTQAGDADEIPDANKKPPLDTCPIIKHPRPIKISLSSLLIQADELYASYPPTHVKLALSTIMGPQSVVFTWSEDSLALPSDADAESMVERPELVVFPCVETPPESADEDEEEGGEKRFGGKEKRARRKLRKVRRRFAFGDVVVERRTVLAGAVVVLGVAVAVYRVRARAPGGGGHLGEGRLGRWLGGIIVGVSDRIMEGVVFW